MLPTFHSLFITVYLTLTQTGTLHLYTVAGTVNILRGREKAKQTASQNILH